MYPGLSVRFLSFLKMNYSDKAPNPRGFALLKEALTIPD
jgi:hypothetical protein